MVIGTIRYPYTKGKTLQSLPYTAHKNELTCVVDLNEKKTKVIKPLDENIKDNPCDVGLGKDVLDMTLKQAMEELDKFAFIKNVF